MYWILECFSCGFPLGQYSYSMFLARIFNYTTKEQLQIDVQNIKQLFESFAPEEQEQVYDFLLTIVQHFSGFVHYAPEVSIQRLIQKYHKIYPFEEKMLGEQFQQKLIKNQYVAEFFNTVHNKLKPGYRTREFKEDDDQINTLQVCLIENKITKQCCRNYLLTMADFYEVKKSFEQKPKMN